MEGHEYGYAIFKPLPDKNVRGSKNTSLPLMTVSNIETYDYNIVMAGNDEDIEVNLSLSPEKLIDVHNDDTSSKTQY